jgi:flavin-dependent dehydrogenase
VSADVAVVGAGPAGAATSIFLAEHGLEVVVLDRTTLPRSRIVCGEYVSPEAGRLLDRLGALKAIDAAGAAALGGMRITAPDGTTIVGRYQPVAGWRPYRQHAMGVARPTLDGALTERLRAAPVDLRERSRVTDVIVEDDRVVGVRGEDGERQPFEVRARVVIAADGRTSVVAERLGCRHPHPLRRLALMTYVSGLTDCRELGEIFVDPPDYAILNPVAADRVNLGLVVPLSHAAPWSSRLPDFLGARIRQLPHAAGFYDPFTGEGVFTALRSAELAAETAVRALRAGDVSVGALAVYQQARRKAFGGKERLTRLLQFVIGHRRLANAACRALARRPALLDALLGVFGDYVPPNALLGLVR